MTALISQHPLQRECIVIYPYCEITDNAQEWKHVLKSIIASINSHPINKRKSAHRDWWHRFWDRSYINVHAGKDCNILTRGYLLQRWINAIGGRGNYPVKFNGSIFNVDGRADNVQYNADYRRWGGGYWFQNTRLLYWSMLSGGDYDMMLPLFDMYMNALTLAKKRTQIYFDHNGAFFPETMTFWGTYNNANYGYERENKPASYVTNDYICYYWQGAIELVNLMIHYYQHTEDLLFAQTILLPFAQSTKHYGLWK